MKTITLRLDDDLHQRLKMYVIVEKTTMQDLLVKLIKEDLQKNEK